MTKQVIDPARVRGLPALWSRIRRSLRMIPFATFFQQATAHGSRSTVLRPLSWFLGICVTAVIASVEAKAPSWVTILFGSMCGASAILFLVAYVYCLFSDRDALRSERYSIQKLALEKGYGDNFIGLLSPPENRPSRPLPQSADSAGDQK